MLGKLAQACLFLFLISIPPLLALADPRLSKATREDSFSFTASGDFAATPDTDAELELIAKMHGSFHLALGDLSYGRIQPESAWSDYVKEKVGADFPFVLISGNHESDGLNGLIDNFSKGLPDKIGVTE